MKNEELLLIEAAENGNLKEVKKYISLGININAIDKYNETALTSASYNGHLEVVEYLISKEAAVNFGGEYGATALHQAAESGHYDICKVLTENGADLNATTKFGTTPLMNCEKAEIANFFIENGAQVDTQDNNGYTALMHYCKNNLEDLAEVAKNNGANPFIINEYGEDVIDIARKSKNNKIQQLFAEEISDRNKTIKELAPMSLLYINPAMKNPKTGENVRDIETTRLQKLKEIGFSIIGLEMTVPELAKLCDKNIDPQHSEGNSSQCCAKEIYENAPKLLNSFVPKAPEKVVFVTNRVDVDSVASYILADRYLYNGQDLGPKENIEKINEHDTFQGSKWTGPKPIEQAFDAENKVAALASSVKVFMVTPQNIKDVETFIDTGEVNETVMNNYRTVQNGIIDRVKSGEIKTEVVGGVAYVETTLPCATNVGYSMAPVVVAVNPAMKLGPQGEPFRKVSICQHEAGYIDINTIKETLNTLETGWGGSPTFIGSKQGENCNIDSSEIKKTVFANLTPEYKQKVTSNTGKINKSKGMGE